MQEYPLQKNAEISIIDRCHGLIQNRVCLLTSSILGGSLVTIDSTLTREGFYMRLLVVLISVGVYNLTRYGKGTNKVYRKTIEHLKWRKKKWLNPEIPKKFFLRSLDGFEDHCAIWYCELQWLYLAAKEYGLEEEFFKMKWELTKNKIPNF